MNAHPPASLKRNFALTTAFTVVNVLYPLIMFAYVSRIMGPTLMGRINLAISLASYFAMVAASAIPMYGAREIAKARNDPGKTRTVFSELMTLGIAATGLATLAYGLCLLISERSRMEWPLFAAAGLFIVANGAAVDWFFQGTEDFTTTLARNIGIKAASLVLLLALVRTSGDYIWVAAIGGGGVLAYNLLGLATALRRTRFQTRGIRPLIHTRRLLVLGGIAVLTNAYLYLDGVLLGYLAGEQPLGLYSAAIRITRSAQVVFVALALALIPRLSAYLESGKAADYAILARKSLHTAYFLCFPMWAVFTAVAPQILRMLAGPEFQPASVTLRIVLPLLPLGGFSNWLGLQILFPRGEEKAMLYAAAAAALANLLLNLLLIPRFGENGAAFSAVAAEACVGFVLVAYARKRPLGFGYWDARATRYLILSLAAGGIAAIAAGLSDSPLAGIAGAAAGGCFYLGALWLRRDPLARDFAKTLSDKVRG